MLKIFNDIGPFIKDNYRRINVREYARIRGISAPSASTLLQKLYEEKLLIKEADRRYIFYAANRESSIFVGLLCIYWKVQLKNLIEYIENECVTPLIILFGSFSKAEVTQTSDIDIALFTSSKKALNLVPYEKQLRRNIQLLRFTKPNEVGNSGLLKNIRNGYILSGRW
jgi:DNA-binding transcriptional ArsR family regulator